jgi:hypothetical protein
MEDWLEWAQWWAKLAEEEAVEQECRRYADRSDTRGDLSNVNRSRFQG